MTRRFEQCRDCPHLHEAFVNEEVILLQCGKVKFRIGDLPPSEIPFHDKRDWDSIELPVDCIYYTERFVEECNEEKT